MQVNPATNLCDVLQQFKAQCTLGILIRDIMVRGRQTEEALCIKICQKLHWSLLIKNEEGGK